MARNEAFRARQIEAMTALMGLLKTKDEDIDHLVKFGLDSMTRHTQMTPDETKIDAAFRGVVEKFEANCFMRQVNELENCYDNWLDYPLGEKKQRNTPQHYYVIDFLLNLANAPIQAAQLVDPVMVEEEEGEEDEVMDFQFEREQIFDPSQWADSDTLSDWSDTEQPNELNRPLEERLAELDHPDLALPDDLPVAPRVEEEEVEPVDIVDVLSKIRAGLDVGWGDTNTIGNRAPWVAADTRRGISDVVRPIISSNSTHDTMKEVATVEHEGISDKGWIIYHERSILRNLCRYGQGHFINSDGPLFNWNGDHYEVKPKLGMSHVTPGSLGAILNQGLVQFATHMRRIHQYLNESENGGMVSQFFKRRLARLIDSRITVYCRRSFFACREKECPISLLIWRTHSRSIFDEARLMDEFVTACKSCNAGAREQPSALESTAGASESGQSALDLLSQIVAFGSKVTSNPNLVHLASQWTELLVWSLWPWVDLIDDLTTMNGYKRKYYSTTVHRSFFDDFPIHVNLKLNRETTWEEIAQPKTHLKWPSSLAPLQRVMKLVTEGIRSKLLMESLEGSITESDNDTDERTLFERFEENAYKVMHTTPEEAPNDAMLAPRKVIGTGNIIDMDKLGLDSVQDPLMRGFVRDMVKQVGTYPIHAKLEQRSDYQEHCREANWPHLWPVLSDQWLAPVVTSIERTTTLFIHQLCHSSIMAHIKSGMDVFLNRNGLIDEIALLICDSSCDSPVQIDLNGLFIGQPYFYARLTEAARLEISYAPPPPASFIFSEEIIASYNLIANYLLQLKLANAKLNRAKIGIDATFDQKKHMVEHMRQIIQRLMEFVFLGLLPKFDCAEQIDSAKTLESIIDVHRQMVAKLVRNLMLGRTEGATREISTNVRDMIRMPIEFPYQAKLETETIRAFIKRCSLLRHFFTQFSQMERDTNMRKWMEMMANTLYYDTQEQHKHRVLSTQMKKNKRLGSC